MKLKVGIYGGTFDPIHNGHLITSSFVLEQRKLDKIIFIPCNISPHKTNQEPTAPIHRLNMLKLAINDLPMFDYSDIEINKDAVSYTYETLVNLKQKYEQIELIIGYDNFLVFDKWHKYDKILELAKVIVMKRTTDHNIDEQKNVYNNIEILDTPIIEISSTAIRDRVNKGLSIDFLVPEKVNEYIINNNLYK